MALLRRLETGPGFGSISGGLTLREANKQYELWAQTWVIEELCDLVPELRKLGRDDA